MGNVGHRAGAVERHEGDDVFEPIRAHLHERLAHAGAFHLEHPDRLAPSHHRVSLGVVERDLAEVDLDTPSRDKIDSFLKRGQGLQTEKVELDQARRLDPFHVELGRRHGRLRVPVERHEFDQRPVADHDAGGVGRSVGIEAFELLGDGEHVRHALVLRRRLLKAGLVRNRLLEGNRMGRVLRHELGEPVDLPERHLEHPSDVAQHAASEERAECDDLSHAVGAVAVAHVGDDLVASLLAEVDVEVRHRHALRIEETLEQQPEPHRIEVSDGERPGCHRARARPAPRTDGNALRLRPFDEVGHDQEVAGELHLDDDVELEGEALLVILLRMARRQSVLS